MTDDTSPGEFLSDVIVRSAVLPMRTPGAAWDEEEVVAWAISEEYGKQGQLLGWVIYMLHYVDNDAGAKGILLAWDLGCGHSLGDLLIKLNVGPQISASKATDADDKPFVVVRWTRRSEWCSLGLNSRGRHLSMALVTITVFERPTGIIGFTQVDRVPVAGEILYFLRPNSPNEECVHRMVIGVVHGPTAGRHREPAAEVHVRTMDVGEEFPWYRGDEE